MPFRILQDNQEILSSVIGELLKNSNQFTYEELGNKVKENYPNEYDQFESYDIGKGIIERNQSYQKYIRKTLLDQMQEAGVKPENQPQNRQSLEEIFAGTPASNLSVSPTSPQNQSFEELAKRSGVKPLQQIDMENRLASFKSHAIEYVIGIAILVIILFLGYKIIQLIIKAYKKADRWLDK